MASSYADSGAGSCVMALPKVAFIGTGGTIASIGRSNLEVQDYSHGGTMLPADELIARFPEVHRVADVLVVPFRAVPSPDIGLAEWRALVLLCERLATEHDDLAGIVIGHGTATLEETAYFLNLTLKISLPVVVVGAQRPASALSSDAGMNLVNALRVAGSAQARGLGVLVLLNDEIHAARDVAKTSTFRMQTFRTPDFGVLGHADGDSVAFYRRPLRRTYPHTEFDVRADGPLPRVDISFSYTDSDGTAVRAFTAAGAAGIVSAGFAPGFAGPGDFTALKEAVDKGVVVVQSTRVGSGRLFRSHRLTEAGFLIADNLTPQKARLLLMLALTRTRDPAEITRMFLEY
jgi:L-asparaginase